MLPLINLSKETANATLYYGKAGFEGRVSASYRDDYLRIVPGLNGQDADATEGSTYIDATMSYAINDHFQVSFEAQNLDRYVRAPVQRHDRAAERVLPELRPAVHAGSPLQLLVRRGRAAP